jgi:hypothetical protein
VSCVRDRLVGLGDGPGLPVEVADAAGLDGADGLGAPGAITPSPREADGMVVADGTVGDCAGADVTGGLADRAGPVDGAGWAGAAGS